MPFHGYAPHGGYGPWMGWHQAAPHSMPQGPWTHFFGPGKVEIEEHVERDAHAMPKGPWHMLHPKGEGMDLENLPPQVREMIKRLHEGHGEGMDLESMPPQVREMIKRLHKEHGEGEHPKKGASRNADALPEGWAVLREGNLPQLHATIEELESFMPEGSRAAVLKALQGDTADLQRLIPQVKSLLESKEGDAFVKSILLRPEGAVEAPTKAGTCKGCDKKCDGQGTCGEKCAGKCTDCPQKGSCQGSCDGCPGAKGKDCCGTCQGATPKTEEPAAK